MRGQMARNSRSRSIFLLALAAATAVAAAAVATAVAWLLRLMMQVAAFARPTADQEAADAADVAIVLGTAVWQDRPSPVFLQRINHALWLYRSGRVRALLFTGGLGSARRLAEAEVARRYVLAQGVLPGHVYLETTSRFTHENLAEAARLMQRHNLRSALLVSDPLHMRRATRMAHDVGIVALPAPTPTTWFVGRRRQAWFLGYETTAYATYLLTRPFLGRPAATDAKPARQRAVETAVVPLLTAVRALLLQQWLR